MFLVGKGEIFVVGLLENLLKPLGESELIEKERAGEIYNLELGTK